MPNLTSVTLAAGLPTVGTGTVSTLDNLVGTAGSASAQVQTVQGVASMTAFCKVDGSGVPAAGILNATVVGTGTFVTQSTSWATVQLGEYPNTTAWKVDGSANTSLSLAAETTKVIGVTRTLGNAGAIMDLRRPECCGAGQLASGGR